jgi:hypothetical protein
MSWIVDGVFDSAIADLDRENRRLEALEKSTASSTAFDHDGFLAINRALSYVVLGGVLEALMRDLPAALAADVLALKVERRKMPVSLIAVMDSTRFRQTNSDTVGSLIARAEVVKGALVHTVDQRLVEDFADALKLADGQTINEKHFQAMWSVLGLDGDWRNTATDSLLIREIREKRNDVAHWQEDLVVIGRSKKPSELRQMASRLSDLVQHFQLSIWYWLDACK